MVDHRKLEAEACLLGWKTRRMCEEAGMLPATYYRRKKNGGMTLDEAIGFAKAMKMAPETFHEIFLSGLGNA